MTTRTAKKTYFLWGLKRSGIHYFINWLYANLGGSKKIELTPLAGRHPQLQRGFHDPQNDVCFFNNCGFKNSRNFSLGDLTADDFELAADSHRINIFGIEDADLEDSVAAAGSNVNTTHIIMMRDPLNNIASRLKGAEKRPEVFPVNSRFIDLYDSYCREFLGHTNLLRPKRRVSYNKMVQSRAYRDALAAELSLVNRDEIDAVPSFGGGSSFSDTNQVDTGLVLERYREKHLPSEMITLLLSRPAVVDICRSVFDYDLEKIAPVEQS